MFARRFAFTIASALALTPLATAQAPVVSGVLNAASFIQPPAIGHALVPGSLATIFGQNLATATATGSPPYPLSLGGTSVSVGSLPATLLYVSPTQINFQVPAELSLPSYPGGYPQTQAPLVVQTAAGSSPPLAVDLYWYSIGIFTLDDSGCGRAAILNVKEDGSVSLNSPDNSAAPGDYLEIFGTGLAVEEPKLPDGYPAPLAPDPIDMLVFPIAVPAIAGTANVTYAGRAPGLVGVDQVNLLIPQNANEGCNVPLSVSEDLGGLVTSQMVPVSIHIGGGTCVDPPQQGSGQITLQRTVFMSSSQPEVDTMTASFITSPAESTTAGSMTAPTAPGWSRAVQTRQDPAAACGTPGVQPVNVGTMTVQSSGLGSVQAAATSTKESLLYTAALPAGAIVPGTYTITASGAGGTGPIQVSLNTGQPIQPTVQLPQSLDQICNQTCSLASPPLLTVNWTGGDASETVNVKIVQHSSGGLTDLVVLSSAPGTVHTMSLALGTLIRSHSTVTYLPVFGSGEIELDVDVVPASPLPAFTVPGLAGGVNATWVYEYRFTGVMP